MKIRSMVAIIATLLAGMFGCFGITSGARGTDTADESSHVDEAPPTFLEVNAPEVADPDVKATFTGSLRRDGEPSVDEWVDLMVDGEDMTHAITDENGHFEMETEMWEAPIHTVQAIASRGSDIEVQSAILTVGVRPVSPDLWGTTVGDESGENVPAVQGWARENTTVNLFTDVACDLEPVATATVEELDAGIPLSVADNSTTKIYASVTNERGLTSDCSDPITYEEDSEAPVVESSEATVVDDGIEVSWTEPTDETGEPEEVTTEVCAAQGSIATGDGCFEAPDAQIVEAEPATTTTTITHLEPLTTYTVATRFTDKVGNASTFLLASNLAVSKYEGADAIQAKYDELGGAAVLGPDRSFVIAADGGWYKSYQNADIYYSRSSGAHEVHGEIRDKLNQLGGTRFGFPTTDETGTPDGRGRYNHFTGNKSIYWTPEWRAHTVEGPVRDKWQERGWETGFGYPVTDTLRTSNGRGKYNFFEGHRAIYWSPETNAHSLYSTIFTKWASLNYENGLLGFPATDQTRTPDGQGEFVHFQGGSIYYSPHSGTREIHGPIWDKWASVGFERGYGYPVTDTTSLANGGMYSHFQDGRSIYYSPRTGAHLVYGMIRSKWESMGWERGALGYPTSDEHSYGTTALRVSRFEGGSIVWNGSTALYVRRVPVVAVLVSDDDGARAATVSSGDVVRIVDFNNQILMKAGVELVFNPADVRGYRNTGTNNLKVADSQSDDVNRWMEQNFPNHLGIFFHQAGASGRNDMRFVFLDPSGGPTSDTLAHEVGHWLDLSHTFLDPTNYYPGGKGARTNTTPEVLAASGGPGGEWRLDGDGLSDTPPDPGATYVKNNLPTWLCKDPFEVNSGAGWSLRFDPQRKNVMSYYSNYCGTADVFTPQQIGVIRNAAKGWMIRDWRF